LERALAEPAGESGSANLESLRTYLGHKLRIPVNALTFEDVRAPLAQKGVGNDALDRLQEIFGICEAASYAGADSSDPAGRVRKEVLTLARDLEQQL